jgi:hypothetical protein
VATLTNGNGISGSSSTEGGTPTIALGDLTSDWNQSGAFDIVLNNAASELSLLESAGATFYGTIDVSDLSANRTYIFPNAGGTVLTTGNLTDITATGTVTSGTWNATAISPLYGGTGVDGSAAGNGTLLIGNGTGYSLANLTQGTGITITNGAGTITVASTLGTDVSLTTEVSGTLPVSNGGTGATTLTSNGVLYGNGTGAVQVTSAGTNGQLLLGSTGAAPAFATMSGDVAITSAGVATIQANSVALTTDTTGNYVTSVANGNGITGGSGGSEGATLTLAINILGSADSTGAVTSYSGLEFQGSGSNELTLLQGCANNDVLIWNNTTNEWGCAAVSGAGGATASGTSGQAAYFTGTAALQGENQLAVVRGGTGVDGSAAANGTLLIGNGSGYVLTTLTQGAGATITNGAGSITIATTLGASVDLTTEVTGVLPVANGGTGASTLTNLIALTTHTTGDYVASLANGNGISGGAAGSEGATLTLAIDLLTASDGAGTTTSYSGLEFQGAGSNELTLLQGCSNNDVLAWDDSLTEWKCTSGGVGGASASGTNGQAAYFNGTSSLAGENQLSVSRGGTGVDGSSASNGTLLIGNGTGFALTTLTQGSGITITNGTGTITVASTLGTDVSLTTEVSGTLPVANGGTGATTLTSNGVLYGNGTSTVQVTAAGTNGQLLLGNTGAAPTFATLSGDATITAGGTLSISANSVALTTDTTGNYVATITAGNGISGSSSTEGGAPTLAVALLSAADSTGATTSYSGLEFQGSSSNELTLLQGCAQDDVLSWNNTTNEWGCASVSGVGGATASGTSGQAAYFTGTSAVQGENQLAVVRGGTGVDGSAAADSRFRHYYH